MKEQGRMENFRWSRDKHPDSLEEFLILWGFGHHRFETDCNSSLDRLNHRIYSQTTDGFEMSADNHQKPDACSRLT